jgi:chromosome segregation ATPase
MDQVEQLEQHVDTLLKLLESAKAKIGELLAENGTLKKNLSEANTQNEQLLAQVFELQGDIEERTGKETQIRDRLRLILSKIDSIETELTSAGSVD